MMFNWVLKERESDNLAEHLILSRGEADGSNYEDSPNYEYCGYLLPDEHRMKDLERGVQRLIEAVNHNQKIVIFGHDDLDGITSTYILFDFLTKIGSQNHFYYIPNRMFDNHGIQDSFVENVNANEYDLVVTVDGCVSSVEGVERLNKLGCDTIITDHHLIPDQMPDAYAIINPKQADCPYPFKMLAGVGVTYFFIRALAEILDVKVPSVYLFWLVTGTIADKAPMTGVNRVLTKILLENWREVTYKLDPQWSLLAQNCHSYGNKITFINSIIRLLSNGRDFDGEHTALALLISPSYKRREYLNLLLPQKERYEREIGKVKSLIESILPEPESCYHIYFDRENQIPHNLMGWTANYISGKLKIPVLIISRKEKQIVCEARCTAGFNLIELFKTIDDILIQYGGHIKAAGFVASYDKFPEIEERAAFFLEAAKEEILKMRVIEIDAEITEQDLPDLSKIFESLAPYGEEFNEPVFLLRSVSPELVAANLTNGRAPFFSGNSCDVVFSFRQDGSYNILDYREL